ncbi:MAG: WD40 repeat domain-containing protein [Natronospirillum sp.]
MQVRWRQSVLSAALAAVFFLTGCADSPERSWQLADRGIYSGAISPDGQMAAIGSVLHGGSLWNIPSFARLYNWNLDTNIDGEPFSLFSSVAFSGDGQRVVTVQGRLLVLWSTRSGQAIFFYEAPDHIRSAALDQQGLNLLLGLEDGTAALFDMVSGQIVARLRGHAGPVHAVTLSNDARRAVTGSDDGSALFWHLPEGRATHRIIHDSQVRTIALSQSGVYAFSVAQRGEGRVWNTNTGQVVRRLPMQRDSISVARFVNNDAMLLTGDRLRKVLLWQLTDSSVQRRWRLEGEGLYTRTSASVVDVRWIQGRVLALGTDGKLALLQ